MLNESDLEKIKSEVRKVRSPRFYMALTMLFAFLAGMQIFYALYHGVENHLYHIAMGGMWLVVAVAIYTIGFMANHYKAVIEKLIRYIQDPH